MCWHAERDYLVSLAILLEFWCGMTAMSIYNKQSIYALDTMLGMIVEVVLQTLYSEAAFRSDLICPNFVAFTASNNLPSL
jgi:hypothetical protein